jgi:Flp pilus assembly protein TadD
MRNLVQRICSGLAVAVVLLICATTLQAQGGTLRGRLFLPNGTFLNEATRISLETGRGVKSTVFTDNQGQFIFPGLTPGGYTLVIEGDRSRYETTSSSIEVFGNSTAILNVVLKERKLSRTAKNGNSISVGELDASVPDKAKKEFEKASTASSQGKPKEAITHLREAIAIYPRYLMAQNDLGVQLLALGKLEEAAVELHKALAIEPKAFNPNLNLGIVLVQQQKFAEGADVLKTAVSLDSGSAAAHLYHGIALEGVKSFELAESELKSAYELGGMPFAIALFHLGHVYLDKGERQRASTALKSYLNKEPAGTKAQEARKLLASIK